MKRRQFMLVLGAGGAVITLSACDSMPESAIAPWKGPDEQQTDPRLRALSWAMLAPSPHNLQSWIADIREPGFIKLHVDLQRLLPHTDPGNRQILIGCGAFVELLRIAASQQGWRAEIELLPEGEYSATGVDARPFALIRMVRAPALAADPLFAAARQRRTNRQPYDAQVPDAAAIEALAQAAERPGIELTGTNDPKRVQRIRALASEGYRVEFTTPATWGESVDVFQVGAAAVEAEPSGVAVLGTDVWLAGQLGLMDPRSLRRTNGIAATRAVDSSVEAASSTQAWIWLRSSDNSRRAQLESGRAYLRVDLTAAKLGLAIHPNSQVLQEFEQMRALYQGFQREVGVTEPARVQMLARLGYASRPEPAPRRPLARIVRT